MSKDKSDFNGCVILFYLIMLFILSLNTCNKIDNLERKVDSLKSEIRRNGK